MGGGGSKWIKIEWDMTREIVLDCRGAQDKLRKERKVGKNRLEAGTKQWYVCTCDHKRSLSFSWERFYGKILSQRAIHVHEHTQWFKITYLDSNMLRLLSCPSINLSHALNTHLLHSLFQLRIVRHHDGHLRLKIQVTRIGMRRRGKLIK